MDRLAERQAGRPALLLYSGPGICTEVSVHRSRRLLRRTRRARTDAGLGPGDPLGLSAVVAGLWLGAYLATWQRAATTANELYEELPTAPPDCFVATAAANGHPRLVRSWTSRPGAGDTFAVTGQLQRLTTPLWSGATGGAVARGRHEGLGPVGCPRGWGSFPREHPTGPTSDYR